MKKTILTTFICSVIVMLVALSGIVIYDNFLNNNNDENYIENNNDNNKNETDNTENEIEPIVYKNIVGTYYNSDYSDLYFSLKENGKLDLVESSCGDGALPLMEGTYEISRKIGNAIILELYGDDKSFRGSYIGFPTPSGHYKFIPTVFGCTEDENTYFVTKSYR